MSPVEIVSAIALGGGFFWFAEKVVSPWIWRDAFKPLPHRCTHCGCNGHR